MEYPKFVQIQVGQTEGGGHILYALDGYGHVYQKSSVMNEQGLTGEHVWTLVANHPSMAALKLVPR